MTDPKETNEEINEELSIDELKSVSGGLLGLGGVDGGDLFTVTNPKGSGYGGTLKDWKKSRQGVVDPDDCPNFNPGETNPELIK